jgi:type II secretory pathway pseudopilin PulG
MVREQRPRIARAKASAFTLVEVLLALGIAIGLLAVALYFYSQAADLRTQLIQETERISATRLIMERLTADLRSARNDLTTGQGLSGDATSLRFLKTDLPSRAAWLAGQTGRVPYPETDLKLVSYGLGTALEGTNLVVSGFVRTEQPFVEPRRVRETPRASSGATETAAEKQTGPEPVTDAIHYARFRYWDGSQWSDSWNATELPLGVEVSLGGDPLPEGTAPEEYPWELFRRVIYLPGNGGKNVMLTFSGGASGSGATMEVKP